eukprot:jgi/Botrbrau1/18567/Bobra.0367s0013.1
MHRPGEYINTAEFFLNNYRLGKTLGIGSFGKVKIAEHVLTGHKVAIKVLNRRKIRAQDMEEKVRREIKILRLFMHPHIIRLYEVVETPNDIYVVCEYVKAGELFDHIVEKGRLVEDEARHFFQQIISGVEYCHRNMVVHRDLKPENLLLDAKMNIKIADFGLSNVMRDGHFLKTSCGSPNYAAPEVISGKLYAGPEVDVWSCGVILYALLCGSLPFDDENIPNLFKKIKGGIYQLPSHLSPGARDLIPRMLLVDPMTRITIPEIRQHPWFTVHLPRYLAVMQADTVGSATAVDEELVREVQNLGFPAAELVDAIRNRVTNKATVTYYLMADNRRRMPSSAYLRAELTEANDVKMSYPLGIMGPSSTPAPPGGKETRVVAEKRWRLGVHSSNHPSGIMAEVCRTLLMLGVSYKKGGSYNLKCRSALPPLVLGIEEGAFDRTSSRDTEMSCGTPRSPLPLETTYPATRPLQTHGDRERVVKFEIQLFKQLDRSRDGNPRMVYYVDVQRISGELYLFMAICGDFITRLRDHYREHS